jgi:BirA family biotin operon repressor/biotin-[acetyl-CoA-carboxylase] ligase
MATAAGWLGTETVWLSEIDSTSDELWRRAAAGAAHGTVLCARTQSAGRGRQGRRWSSAPGNLLASWLLRFSAAPTDLSALSIVEALAITRTLDRYAPGRIQLKWPNDILLDGRKLGGLLLEARQESGLCVVTGLGLNLCSPADGWGILETRAIAFDAVGVRVEADQILAALCPALEIEIDRFMAEGPLPAFADWSSWSALDGNEIGWDDGGESYRGRVLGLAPDGGLRVATHDGHERILRSGEVHLRRAS